ncbi:hypothetical protein [Desertibaculum subflavum]|uniref:hypothetical protein n=1 Tax=Desertibaculum subflavum TaxID=2268458 RepID=UPI000E66FE2C
MNTTALYVEPLFIGALFLLVLGLPFAPEVIQLMPRPEATPPWLAVGTVLAGIAYFAGILFDRYLDSCLAPLEGHIRLSFARGTFERWQKRKRSGWRDPFPEDVFRTAVMTGNDKAAEFLDYVRTRLRLMRALAFALPLIAFGGVVGWQRLACREPTCFVAIDPPAWCAAAWVPSALGWACFLVPALLIVQLLALEASGRWSPFCRDAWKPADTRKAAETTAYFQIRAKGAAWRRNCRSARDVLVQPCVLIAIALFLLASAFACQSPSPASDWLLAGVLAGNVLAIGAGWAWWRITCTFLRYLKLYGGGPDWGKDDIGPHRS